MRSVAGAGARMITYGEHVALRLTEVLPLAFADRVSSIDNGADTSDREGAGCGAMGSGLGDASMQSGPVDPRGALRAAHPVFGMANMTPSDIHFPKVGDSLTGNASIRYEDLGFADRFEGYPLAEAEVASVGGALPVHPSGGMTSTGHPPGATDVAQCVGLFQQLRGEASHQVDGARVTLAHNVGAPTALSAATFVEGPGGYVR